MFSLLLQPLLQPLMRGPMEPSGRTLIQRAIAVLRRFGQDAHIYLPGVGMLNGLQAGNYLDSAGTTAGTVDQPVGLVLDAAGSLGVELAPAIVPAGTGWTNSTTGSTSITFGTGTIAFVTDGLSNGAASFNGSGVAGKSYRVDITATGTGQLKLVYGGPEVIFTGSLSVVVVYGVSGNSFSFSRVVNQSANMTVAVSVREVTGIAAQQPTTASKPILRRGAVAMNPYSQDYTQTGWAKVNVTPLVAQLDPFGGTLATKMVEGATVSTKEIALQAQTVVAGSKYTFAIVVKAGERSRIRSAFNGSIFPGGNSDFADLSTGLVLSTGGSSASSIAPLGNGWHLYVVTQTANSSGITSTNFITLLDNTNASGYLGDGTSGAFIHRAALFQGTYTAAQIQALGGIPTTTTAPASTALGSYFWQFDGSNDSLSLGGPLFQQGDDYAIIAAYQPAASGFRTIFGQGQTSSTNGLLELSLSDVGFVRHLQRDGSTSIITAIHPVATTPNATNITTAYRRGSKFGIRHMGVQSQELTQTAQAPVLDVAAIGMRTGLAPGSMMNGGLGPMAFLKGQHSDADLLLIEKMLGQMSGVTIP